MQLSIKVHYYIIDILKPASLNIFIIILNKDA